MEECNNTIIRRPHIVAFPFPLQGHINPMLLLCQRLCSTFGFCITFVNSSINHTRLLESRGSALESEQQKGVRFVGLPDGLDCLSPGMDGLREAIASSGSMQAPFQQLIQKLILEGSQINCILSDTFVSWTQDVAKTFHIPYAAYSTTCVANDLLVSFLPRLMEEGYVPLNPKASYMDQDHRISFVPGMPPFHPLELPFACRMKHRINSHLSKTYTQLHEADFILVNSISELEDDAVQAMRNTAGNYMPIGPVLPIVYTDSKPRTLSSAQTKCLEWLDTQEPNSVLYVSFGSIACLSNLQIEELLLGLKSAKQPFLLVMRDSLVFGLSGDFYADFLDATKDFSYITSWAPQMEVLGHSAVGGFLSHCGWNSTLESIYNGVPVLGWPCMAEQNLNCMLLVKQWKVALGLQGRADGIIDQREVEDKIRRLMQNEEGGQVRRRMLELRDKMREAVKEKGSSRCNLESFAMAVKKNAEKKCTRQTELNTSSSACIPIAVSAS